jgi:hypothetical protein
MISSKTAKEYNDGLIVLCFMISFSNSSSEEMECDLLFLHNKQEFGLRKIYFALFFFKKKKKKTPLFNFFKMSNNNNSNELTKEKLLTCLERDL